MLILYSDRSHTPSHLLQQTQHHSPKCCQPSNKKVELLHSCFLRWLCKLWYSLTSAGLQTKDKQMAELTQQCSVASASYTNCGTHSRALVSDKQIVVLVQLCYSTRYTNGGTPSRVSTLKLGDSDRDRLVCAEQN